LGYFLAQGNEPEILDRLPVLGFSDAYDCRDHLLAWDHPGPVARNQCPYDGSVIQRDLANHEWYGTCFVAVNVHYRGSEQSAPTR
jgi:hypothetical protein